ncbi:L-lactate permease [Bacillus sp. 165]|uniref:L-lactate permease n=1 Tax=Bacillus sp. 165 TaxID=1529117 RepID=UPI001ADB040B|nr:L-lactate permease [Bacillus sp. 165]
MKTILALSPILSIFIFLFVCKLSSMKSAILSYIMCLLVVLLYPPYYLQANQIYHSTIKGALICFIVGYVLFFGIFLFHLMNKMGVIQSIAAFISQTTHDRLLQTFLLCFGLCPLIESASGFGIGFMVTAPIFLSIGYPPLQAALLSFIGLLASAWGALATGTIIGSHLIHMSLTALGTGTAILSIPIFLYFMGAALFITGGWSAIKEKRKELISFFLLFSISIYFFNRYVSVELSGILSAILTTGFGLMVIQAKRQPKKAFSQNAATRLSDSNGSILKMLSPYLFLTACILFSRLNPMLKHSLQEYAVIDLPRYTYTLALLYSPGFWLSITCLFTIFLFRIPGSIVRESLYSTIRQWIPFAVTTTMFISVSEIMGNSGMHQALAAAAGSTFGTLFMVIAPFIGAMGGFLTGSNAGSNAMFIQLQLQTAQHVNLPKALIAMSQNTSSSISTIACPSRITLGSLLCGIPHRESELLKKTTLLILGGVVIVVLETVIAMQLFS